MNKYTIFILFFILFASCNNKNNNIVYTLDNPSERIVWEKLRLMDPVTREIPRDIRKKERMFAKTLPKENNQINNSWIHRGPYNVGGRTRAIALDVLNENIIFAGGASGGMFRSVDGGQSWVKTTDPNQLHNVTCVSQDIRAGKENIWYFGSGELTGSSASGGEAYYQGNGIYKSVDSGLSWDSLPFTATNTNGFDSDFDFIWNIKTDPSNDTLDILYAATYGSIYKSEDGGESWSRVLNISEHTGFNEIHLDPRDPNILYATSHQRQRKVWTYISGGPESGLYKSVDGGINWIELKNGIPGSDKGRIALAISPVNPDIIYCMIEGHGFYKSINNGSSFKKQSEHSTSGNYYVELFASPHNINTVYSMDTYAQWSEDGGKSFKRLGENGKHVDNHIAWIDPNNKNHLILGCDGGIYETWDHANSWHFKSNLPITQFYRVATDNASPFYNVYGGTQDNFSLGGPSRTINNRGIVNSDWYVTQTGDGFESQVDPLDPNIVYAQAQYGWLRRYDRLSGEGVPIKPLPGVEDKPLRWNWDAPLLISPHDHKTLYFAANKLFKSTDRGDSWETISGDLTRQIDRNALPLMDKIWSIDAIGKNRSTTIYGNIVSLHESSLEKGLIYIGTDDGLIQVTVL